MQPANAMQGKNVDTGAVLKTGIKSFDSLNTGVQSRLADVGIGMGSALGRTVTGLPEAVARGTGGALKMAGLDKVGAAFTGRAEQIKKFGQDVFEKPFEKNLNTFAGKTGQVVGGVAPYLLNAPQAAAGLVGKTVALGKYGLVDTAISQAQTGGNVGVGAATFPSSVAAGLLGAPGRAMKTGVKGALSRGAAYTAPGYIYDVAAGVAGERGEDRKGAAAFIPGSGTAFAGGLGGALGVKNFVRPPAELTVQKRLGVFDTLEKSHTKVQESFAAAERKGVNAKQILAETDLLNGAVDKNGTVDVTKAHENFDKAVAPYEATVRTELEASGDKVNITDIVRERDAFLKASKLEGAAYTSLKNKLDAEIRGFTERMDADGNIALTRVQDAKVSAGKRNDYLDPEPAVSKESTRFLKETVENHATSIDVKTHNAGLAKMYAIRDVLDSLDKRKVEGGRLRKHFSTLVGALAGGHAGGPLGAIFGGEIARAATGVQMSRALGGRQTKTLQAHPGMIQSNQSLGANTTQRMTTIAPRASIDPSISPRGIYPVRLSPKQPRQPITRPERLLSAPRPPAIPLGGEVLGQKVNARGELVRAPLGKSGVKVVPAKPGAPRVNPLSGRMEKTFTSEAHNPSPKVELPDKARNNPRALELHKKIEENVRAQERAFKQGDGAKLSRLKTAYNYLVRKFNEVVQKIKDTPNKQGGFLGGTDKKPLGDNHLTKAQASLREAKGLSASDIMAKHPDINLKRDVPITDVRGNKAVIPAGEALTPYELKGNKVLLQDGETYIVSKNQYQNIKGNAVSGEAKEFAPELKGTEEAVMGGSRWQGDELIDNGEVVGNLMKNDDGTWSYQSDFSDGSETFKTRQLAMDDAENSITGTYSGRETKYSSYTLPDGKNYKEVLIKAGDGVPQELKKPFDDYLATLREKYGTIKGKMDYTPAELKKLDELGAPIRDWKRENATGKPSFISSHWKDEPNVISHLRLNERTYKGKPVTFMEELQSDWAREGKKQGFSEQSAMDAERKALNEQRDAIVAKYNDNGNLIAARSEMPPSVRDEERAISLRLAELSSGKAIPSHPLVEKGKWVAPSVKRALQEAVANKSEYFAWINGEQTSARYNLATHLENASWKTNGQGSRSITLKPKQGGEDIFVIVNKDGEITAGKDWHGKKLDEVLGKGLADSIMAKESGTLSGDGLKFGGEWANTLYDKQVKNIVEDVTGGKVENLDMGLPVEKNTTKFIIQGGRDAGGTLTKNALKTGLEINIDVPNGATDYVVTRVGDGGKFEALRRKYIELSVKNNPNFLKKYGTNYAEAAKEAEFRNAPDVESFDISIKTTMQQGIRITDAIRAKILGEAPVLKKPSGVLPKMVK